MTTIDPTSDTLIADLITASFAMTRDTGDRLIASLQAQVDDGHATIDAIRDRISGLLSGPYQPTADAIMSALWPSDTVLDEYRRPTE